jgi:hypothetical protein
VSIYIFSPGAPVKEVAFRYADDRPPVALITAAQGVEEDQLSTVRRAMEFQGWTAVPAEAGGKHVLQVSGFKDEGQLAALLLAQHFAKGTPLIQAEPGDHSTRTYDGWLQDNSLKGAGWLNLIGDVALLGSGIKGRKGYETVAGGLYTAGALNLVQYGNLQTDRQLRLLLEDTGEFMKEQAARLPEECGLFSILKDRKEGKLDNAEQFLYRYPAQATLSAYTLGAAAMLASGLKQRDWWGVGYGVNSVGLKLASLMIPEKKKEAVEKPHGILGEVKEWIQEKPLRVFGYGSLVTEALLGMSAYREYKADPHQKSYIFKFITTGTYAMADILMAISNKDRGKVGAFDAQEKLGIEALTAEVIAAQPKDMQKPLIDRASTFLAMHPEMNAEAPEIAAAITRQVAEMEKNPWVCRPGEQGVTVRDMAGMRAQQHAAPPSA